MKNTINKNFIILSIVIASISLMVLKTGASSSYTQKSHVKNIKPVEKKKKKEIKKDIDTEDLKDTEKNKNAIESVNVDSSDDVILNIIEEEPSISENKENDSAQDNDTTKEEFAENETNEVIEIIEDENADKDNETTEVVTEIVSTSVKETNENEDHEDLSQPAQIDPYSSYSQGIGFNGVMMPYTFLSNNNVDSNFEEWITSLQNMINSNVICRSGNHFSGHNPGPMQFLTTLGLGDTVTIKANSSATNYRVSGITDLGDFEMPTRTYNAVVCASNEICIQFCYNNQIRMIYAIPS